MSILTILALLLGLVGATSGSAAVAAPPIAPAAITTNTLKLNVVSGLAAGGHALNEAITQYKYLINEDNTGDPHDTTANCLPAFNPTLAGCQWPSIHKMQGDAPVVTQGTEADFAGGLDLGPYLAAHPGATKFLISVVADGFKVGGQHFSLPLDSPNNTVDVVLEPDPLPTATFRAMVFNDNTSPNGAFDVPGEDGLNGFEVRLDEILGQISTDWFGNPLCTEYQKDFTGNFIFDADGAPIPIDGTGGMCLTGDTNHDGKVNPPTIIVGGVDQPNPDYTTAYPADDPADQGMVVIPNLGSNRVAAIAIPPDGSDWVETTTLEGWHDVDTWMLEGSTGYDTEFLKQRELFPWTFFGFVKPKFKKVDTTSTSLPGTAVYPGEVTGTAWAVKIYVPPQGGLNINNFGIMGAKRDYRVNRPYVALSDLNNGDQMVYMGRGNPDGTFDIKNVPPSDYLVTVWDGPQNLILDGIQRTITVGAGVVPVGDTWDGVPGNVALAGWWARFDGHVFIDNGKAANGSNVGGAANGKRDCLNPNDSQTCEAGLPQQLVGLKMRGNNVMQHGSTGILTDANGYYNITQGYPITVWIVEEVYNDLYKTTGVTYQADNQPTETTVLGTGVDVNVLPIIGLSGRLDWGVLPYDRGDNGGIVGTVTYDVTRNELDPRFAVTEDWQPGIPGLQVDLFKPVPCAAGHTCDPSGKYQVEADGSFSLGDINGVPTSTPIQTYTSESWDRPTGCTALDVNGVPIVQQALPTGPSAECVEAPMSGIQFGPMSDGTTFGATVDGNYGFGDLTPGDYLVKVEIPKDFQGRPLFKVTKEEDINIFSGDTYVPQVPPPACAGALHTVTVVSDPLLANFDPANPGGTQGVYNPDFVDGGGSPWEGQRTPLCDVKLIPVQNRKSIAPNFNLFTDVPLPARYMGLTVDNLNLSVDPKSIMFGEVAGVPHNPFGVYDFTGRLLYTGESDANGIWEVLMPSTLQINCPTPSGVCPDMYNFVGNDPGQPYHRNANYNPQYQTISAAFEAWPGVINPADLAPMPVAATIAGPGNSYNALAECVLPGETPKLFAVNTPVFQASTGGTLVISGDGFGAFGPNSRVTLDNTALTVISADWANGQITADIPAGFPAGPHQLLVAADNGQSTINGLTVHVLGGTYNPTVIEVGPGKTHDPTNTTIDPVTGLPYEHALQNALDDAANAASTLNVLVVVYANTPSSSNPAGAYFENIIVHSPVKLQGVGPGGIRADGSVVDGSIIDGVGYNPDATPSTDWYALVNSLSIVGNPNISDGMVVYVLATSTTQFGSTYKAAIDGFAIQGGDELGIPANVIQQGGGRGGGGRPTFVGDVPTQGGGIYVHGYAHYLQITNNIVRSNSGAYGGGIRIGTPTVANHNDNLLIARNRFLANGGTNLAGAIGLFQGADGYEVANNDLCGNFSAEYGGAISHFGLSPNGKIHDNRIYFNQSVDEGAGIIVAGELPTIPGADYGAPGGPQGAGAVDIYNNLIQSNIAGDDGGGLRFLMAGDFPYNVYNNFIVNNLSAHEGGGVALDDAPNVRFYNNTVMKNISTDTAATAMFGTAYPAGLSTGDNSVQLQNTLPLGSPTFSDPLMFNNIFRDNRAGSYNAVTATVEGIGLTGDLTAIRYWDMGSTNPTIQLSPTNSILNGGTDLSYIFSNTSNQAVDPLVVLEYDTKINVYPWRSPNQPAPVIIAVPQPGFLDGDYHLQAGSPAVDMGAASKSLVNAPAFDIDNQARPAANGFDAGADEIPVLADLSITKNDGLTFTLAGSTVHYTITVSNAGPDATAATVTDAFPAAFSSVSWTCTAGCAASVPGDINMTLNLLNGDSVTFTADATLSTTANTSVSNTASVAAASGATDPNTSNNSATDTDTIPTADLSISKTHAPEPVLAGGTITYTIGVSNAGPDAVTGASVTDTFPAGLTGITWTCSAAAGSTCGAPGGSGNINATVDLAANGSASFSVTATTTQPGTLVNTASIAAPAGTADPTLANNSSTDSANVVESMHIGDLDWTAAFVDVLRWRATVTVTVHDSNHNPLANATVTGVWSAGDTSGRTLSCVTNVSGQCSVTSGRVTASTNTSVQFSVSNVSATGYGYLSSANHDPDSGAQASDGTTITAAPAFFEHVGDLDWTAATVDTTRWRATVTVTVHDANHNPLAGAIVAGSWSAGDTNGRTLSCVTNASGQCNVTSGRVTASTNTSVQFTVALVLRLGYYYTPSANHDPDIGAQASNGATITASPTFFMHVGDLDQASNNTSATLWRAQVTITVHDNSHSPVAGALVTVSWAGGGAGGTSCTTTATGQCTVTRTGLSRATTSSVTMTVTNVTNGLLLLYVPGANHDPDSGAQASNGATITVPRP